MRAPVVVTDFGAGVGCHRSRKAGTMRKMGVVVDLAAHRSGRRVVEQGIGERDATRLRLPEDPQMKPVGKAVGRLPVGDGGRQNIEKASRLRRPPEHVVDDLGNGLHDEKIFKRLEDVKRLDLELTEPVPPGDNRGMWTPDTSLDDIAARLCQTREALGMNQAEFAKKAGIAPNTYNQYEQGVSRPYLDKAMAICKAHRLTLDWIYFGDPFGLPHAIASKLPLPERAAAS